MISPFLAATRGVAFEIVNDNGEVVAPRKPMGISPPAPPLTRDKLTRVDPATTLKVNIVERTETIFPQAGHYRVKAIIRLMNLAGRTATYQQVRTNYVDLNVTP